MKPPLDFPTDHALPAGVHRSHESLPLEYVGCYLCGEASQEELVNDPPFRVLLCTSCSLGYTSPRIAAHRIHEIYHDQYFQSDRAESFGYAAYEADLEAYLRTFRRKLRVLGPHIPAGPVLEVGCAAGAFLKVMQDRGHEVWGIELAPRMLDIARQRFGFERLHNGRLDEVAPALPQNHFGTVAMFDVVEHVPDPCAELRRCHRLLREDGILVLQTQDVLARARRVLGSRWHHFKQPEHIYHFSPKAIEEVLQRSGFRILQLTRRDAGKYVSCGEIGERAHRVAGLPRWLCAPLRWAGKRYVYVNPKDEMLIVAQKVTPDRGKPESGVRPGPS